MSGKLDEEGYLYLVDRKKDMICSGGVNIYPSDIEAILLLIPQILECAVIGVPDPKWGEAVKAVVVLREKGKRCRKRTLLQHCKANLAGYQVPKSVNFYIPSEKSLRKGLEKGTQSALLGGTRGRNLDRSRDLTEMPLAKRERMQGGFVDPKR